jgi:hypothetical protein
MNYRLATILAREAHTSDTTKVIDLNLQDPVSQIQVVYESTGAASGAPTALGVQCVEKIELVDGSDVLYSLSGAQAQAADWYDTMREPGNQHVYLNDMNAEMIMNMNFGRWLWDTEYAFDPTKFVNPQLKITLDIDAGGQSSDGGYLTVLANIFDQKEVSPTGFLMHKEIKDYAFGAGTHEYTDLPTDYPYRKLYIASLVAGTGADYIFDNIKLSEDNDRRIPINHTIADVMRAIVGQGRPYREKVVQAIGGSSGYFYCTPTYWPKLDAISWEGSNNAYTLTIFGGDGGRGKIYGEGTLTNVNIGIEGYAPHGVLAIPFGMQDDPADWYDVTKLGSLRLDITSASGMSSSQTCQIMTQQSRAY